MAAHRNGGRLRNQSFLRALHSVDDHPRVSPLHRTPRGNTGVRCRSRNCGLDEKLARNRRGSHRPAIGAGKADGRPHACARACVEKGITEVAARPVAACADRADSVGDHHAPAGPRHGHRVHRDLLRDVVLVRRSLAAPDAARKPGGQPHTFVQHRHVGRVVSRSGRAYPVLQAVSGRRNHSSRGEHRNRGSSTDPLGEARAVSAEPAQGISRSVG